MTLWRRRALTMLLALTLAGALPAPLPAAQEECGALAARLEEQNLQLSGELRRIQRELAALRADLDRPGAREVFGGLGYILGLFGVAAFVAARRKG